ncbi:MAG: transporter substrate-binding domain-containing protein, partial [Tissierellia bacterium]|nr:transporter substrate-binding domain-containing protein [Tissierellia bacterium]
MKKFANRTILSLLILIVVSAFLPINSEAARTSIKVAVNHNFPPFQFIDKKGNIVGLNIDIMNEIAQKEDLIVDYIVFNETNKAVEALENGLVDVVLGIVTENFANNELRNTNDIYSATLSMLVGNENVATILSQEQNLKRYSVAFEIGTISFSQINSRNNILV